MNEMSFETFSRRFEIETLCAGSIFGAISQEATRFLLKQGNIYDVRAGETVFHYGDPGSSFFVVCQGQLAFYKHHEKHTLLTRLVEFGEEVGFVAMIALHDHAGHAVAVEDSVVLEISSGLFGDLHRQYPLEFGLMLMNLARDLARVVRKLSDTIVDVGT